MLVLVIDADFVDVFAHSSDFKKKKKKIKANICFGIFVWVGTIYNVI